MKRIALLALASGMAIAAATPANAAILIGVGFNGSAPVQVATDNNTGSVNYNTTTGGYFYNVSGTGFPLLTQPNLLTQSVNIQQVTGTGGTLNVYITETDLSSFNSFLASIFTSNSMANATTRITSYYSTTNALWGGTQLTTTNFTSPGATASGQNINVTGPFSTTIRYDITFGAGSGNFNGTANLTAVPEPATWGMMIMGFGLMGGVLRRRKATVAFA